MARHQLKSGNGWDPTLLGPQRRFHKFIRKLDKVNSDVTRLSSHSPVNALFKNDTTFFSVSSILHKENHVCSSSIKKVMNQHISFPPCSFCTVITSIYFYSLHIFTVFVHRGWTREIHFLAPFAGKCDEGMERSIFFRQTFPTRSIVLALTVLAVAVVLYIIT